MQKYAHTASGSVAHLILHSPFAQEQDLLTDKAGLLTDCAKQVPQTRLLKLNVQWLMRLLDTKHSNGCCTGITPASLFTRNFSDTLHAYGIFFHYHSTYTKPRQLREIVWKNVSKSVKIEHHQNLHLHKIERKIWVRNEEENVLIIQIK